ncbi:MAG: hypothetical protein QXS54_12575 [Candidatus Methanomethylicaceae archaeon]
MHHHMSLLRDLQALDHYIDRLRQEVAELDDGERIRAALCQLQQSLDKARHRHREMNAAATDLDLYLQSINEKLSQAEATLYSGRVQNSRELLLLQQEIDMMKALREKTEDELLDTWANLENVLSEIEELERDFHHLTQRYEAHMKQYNQRKSALESEIQSASQKRTHISQLLHPDVAQRYEKLRELLGGTAVSSVENQACSSCRTLLTPYLYRRLQIEDALVACENCGRLLYDASLITEQ